MDYAILSLIIVALITGVGAAVYFKGRSDQKLESAEDENKELAKTAQDFADTPVNDADFTARMRDRIEWKDQAKD